MKKLFLFSLILGQSLLLVAMQKPAPQLKPSALDVLPKDIQILIAKSITGDTLDAAIAGIKRFYIASPKSRESVATMTGIISYIIDKFDLYQGKELQDVVDKLSKLENFPVFKNPEMLEWIRKQKQRLDNEEALKMAAGNGDIAKVKQLIAEKVNVNKADKFGNTALMYAADLYPPGGPFPGLVIEKIKNQTRYNDIVEFLIKNGADANKKNGFNGNTAIIKAANQGADMIVKTLLKKGVDINAKGPFGSALSIAVASSTYRGPDFYQHYKKTIQLLLEAGANTDEKIYDKKLITFINDSRLTNKQKNELVELLRKYGAPE